MPGVVSTANDGSAGSVAMPDVSQSPSSSCSVVEAAGDDVLLLLFRTLAGAFSGTGTPHKAAVSRFIWFRSTLPLVCKRWARLLLGQGSKRHHHPASTAASVWCHLLIDPSAESLAAKRSINVRACQEHYGVCLSPRGGSGSSTPARGASPLLGSSPDSDSGGYWSSQFAPAGGSPARQRLSASLGPLSRLSLGRPQRIGLHARAVLAWLAAHPAVAGSVSRLTLDLSHHTYHDFSRHELEQLLCSLPRLTAVHLVGAVEGTDAYEPLGRLRHLQDLELSSASQACLDGGLMALGFLPHLRHLSLSLDIPPASPSALPDLPTGLVSLKLGGMWLEALPQQLAELAGLTNIELERCQCESNPLPLLLALPGLASISVRSASRGSSEASLPLLLPMTRPQLQPPPRGAAAGRHHAHHHHHQQVHAGGAAAGSSAAVLPLVNTSVTSLSLVDVGLQQLPSCVSQLVALRDLSLALNHELGLHPGRCLPPEMAALRHLQGLCLGHCGLGQLPPVVAALSGLTRLELQGNALSCHAGSGGDLRAGSEGGSSGWSGAGAWPAGQVAFAGSLRVLDLGAQGSGRVRMKGIPGWVGCCGALRELRIGAHCLVGTAGSSSSVAHALSTAAAAAANVALGAPQAAAAAAGAAAASPARRASGSSRLVAGASSGGGGSSSRQLGQSASMPSPHSTPVATVHASSSAADGGLAGSGSVGLADGLSLKQLPVLLPQLELLVIEGGVWDHRAVREALQLVRQLERDGSRLQLVLPE